jgi:hypothetical protein
VVLQRLAVVGDPVTLISDPVTLISDPVTLISDPVTLVGNHVSSVRYDSTLAQLVRLARHRHTHRSTRRCPDFIGVSARQGVIRLW